jgi:hypothetical protein
MLQVAAPIWNEIAKTQKLATSWARKWFAMDQDELNAADQKEYEEMKAKGISHEVAASLQMVRPLLWERAAINRHLQKHPELTAALPTVNSPNEAVILASMERDLSR